VIISLNAINKSIFARVKCSVLFEVRNEFLNIILTNVGFKELMSLPSGCIIVEGGWERVP
jgi:hypothetical protein